MTNNITLKELMEEKFRALDARIYELKLSIDRLAQNTVAIDRFESQYRKVGELHEAIKNLDTRLDKAESYIGIWRYIGAGIVTIILALIIAYLSGRLP